VPQSAPLHKCEIKGFSAFLPFRGVFIAPMLATKRISAAARASFEMPH